MATTLGLIGAGAGLSSLGGLGSSFAAGRPDDPDPDEQFFSAFGPGNLADPLLASLSLDQLVQLGIGDPNAFRSILSLSSPFSQAIATYGRSGEDADSVQLVGRTISGLSNDIDEMIAQGMSADEISRNLGSGRGLAGIENAPGIIGISFEELVRREVEFRQSIGPEVERLSQQAQAAGASRTVGLERIAQLTQNIPQADAAAIAALQAREQERLLRELNRGVDEQRADLLRQANAAGFNPGRAVGDIEEFRARATQDSDLDALGRAIATLGGQQQLAANEVGLLQSLIYTPQQSGASLAQLRTSGFQPTGTGIVPPIVQPPSPLAAGISSASSIAGNTLASLPGILAEISALNRIPGTQTASSGAPAFPSVLTIPG